MRKKSGIERIVIDPEKLRDHISAAGYKSQSQFGRAIGMDGSHVARMCRIAADPYDLPDGVRLSMLARIVNALGLHSMDPIVRYLPIRKPKVADSDVTTEQPVSPSDPIQPEPE